MWSSSNRSNEFLHTATGRDCIEGNPPGTIHAAFVLWATQLDQVRVHSDDFATGTVRRVVVAIDSTHVARSLAVDPISDEYLRAGYVCREMDQLNKFLLEKHLNVIDPKLCAEMRRFYIYKYEVQSAYAQSKSSLSNTSRNLNEFQGTV